jgi:hypothetical protein
MSLLRKIAGTALDVAGVFVPGVATAAKVINAVIGEGEQLDPEKATGRDVLAAYNQLPDSSKQYVDQEFETKMAEIQAGVDNLKSMVSAETASGNTRPFIALLMAWAVFFAVSGAVLVLGAAVTSDDSVLVEKLGDTWPLLLAILGTPTALLRAYFGLRTKEKQARYAAATGQPIADVVGGLARLFKK